MRLDAASLNPSTRLDSLKSERDRLRALNATLERTLDNFRGAHGQLERLQGNIETTHGLMSAWEKLMSQTEHTRELVLDPQWSQANDLRVLEAQQQQQQQQQEEEEQQRQAAEVERQRLAAEEEKEAKRLKEQEALEARQSQQTRGSFVFYSLVIEYIEYRS